MSYSLPIINKKIEKIRQFALTEDMHVKDDDIKSAVVKFMKFKECVGNINNDIHYLTTHLANDFLKKKHGVTINVDKPSGSGGLDIESHDIVAEIKTTIPYQQNDFGAKQKSEIIPNLKRLESSFAKYKYFFVTDSKTERILKSKYMRKYPSVVVINLLNDTHD